MQKNTQTDKSQKNGKTAQAKRKLPFWVAWVIGYLCTLLAAVGLAYYWRVVYMLAPDLPAVPFTLGIMGLFTLLYAVLFLICRFCKSLPLRGAVLVFVLGLLFVFANAPLQAPDEVDHYKRAVSISMGRFNYDGARGFPRDVDVLVESFPGGYNHKVSYQQKQMIPAAFAQYRAGLESERNVTPQKESTPFNILPFVLQGLAMAAARLFGADALGLLYAGRIANLLAYALVCWLVFKNCDKYRGVFFAVAALPLSLFIAASCSYDALMLAACFLAVSFFCKNKIFTKDVVVFGLAIAYATYLKPNNLVLVAVLLLVPKARWKTKINPWLALGVMLVGSLALRWATNQLNGGVLLNNIDLMAMDRGAGLAQSKADGGAQLMAMIKNPPRFVAVALLTLVENAGFLFGGALPGLGTLGTLDLTLPLVGGLSVLSMASASALGIQQKDDTKATGALALLLAALLYGGAVLAGLYLAHTEVGSIRITGLQPRYFLPAFLLIFMLASILLGKAVRPRLALGADTLRIESVSLWMVAGVALLSVILLFGANFVGQWILKAEGGWKMVNLFRWVQV